VIIIRVDGNKYIAMEIYLYLIVGEASLALATHKHLPDRLKQSARPPAPHYRTAGIKVACGTQLNSIEAMEPNVP